MSKANAARRLVKRSAGKIYRHAKPKIERFVDGLFRLAKREGLLDRAKAAMDSQLRSSEDSPERLIERLKGVAAAEGLGLQLQLEGVLTETFTSGSRLAFKQIGFNAAWSLDTTEARLALDKRLNLLSGVSDTLFERIARVMHDALFEQAAGPVTPQTLKAIERLLPGISKVRAETIARTEATAVINEAQHITWQHNGVTHEQWVYSQSGYDRHEDMDGETVATGEPFSNGCQYPGDPAGEAGEVINCLCTVIPVFDDDELPTAPNVGIEIS